MRVVGSLSTTLHKISHIEPVLKSIQTQPLDKIYIIIDYECPIPNFIHDYCTIIKSSGNSLFATILAEKDPDTIIISFADNKIYPEGLVEKLLNKHYANPNVAIGSSGIRIGTFPFYFSTIHNQHDNNKHWFNFDIDSKGEEVDILSNEDGVLYKRNFFPTQEEIQDYIDLQLDDDVLSSGVLSLYNIPRLIFKMPRVNEVYEKSNVLSFLKSVYLAKRSGMFSNPSAYQRRKTFTFPIILATISIIILAILLSIREKK